MPSESDNTSRFRAAADIAPVMIWMSGTDRRCDWFNQPWLRFTGRSMAEEVGDGWLDSVHPEDVERCVGIYTVSFDAQVPYEMDYRLRRHDGAYRWILSHGVPHHAPDGRFMGYVGCCIDIDERRSLEDRLALRTEALRLSERRRDHFLTALAEELGASLSSARQTVFAMNDNASPGDALDAATRLTETLQAQLSRLLGEAKRSARSAAAARLNDRPRTTLDGLLRQGVEAVPLPLLRPDARLRVETPEPGHAIAADPRLGQLIGRVLEAALETSEPTSSLAVSASLDERRSVLWLRIAAGTGRFLPSFAPVVLAHFAQQEARDSAQPGRPDEALPAAAPGGAPSATPQAPGIAAFTEPGGRSVSFVIGSPWVDGPAS